jgi:hypothetical protein
MACRLQTISAGILDYGNNPYGYSRFQQKLQPGFYLIPGI